jgi:hypothetical protein
LRSKRRPTIRSRHTPCAVRPRRTTHRAARDCLATGLQIHFRLSPSRSPPAARLRDNLRRTKVDFAHSLCSSYGIVTRRGIGARQSSAAASRDFRHLGGTRRRRAFQLLSLDRSRGNFSPGSRPGNASRRRWRKRVAGRIALRRFRAPRRARGRHRWTSCPSQRRVQVRRAPSTRRSRFTPANRQPRWLGCRLACVRYWGPCRTFDRHAGRMWRGNRGSPLCSSGHGNWFSRGRDGRFASLSALIHARSR